MSEHDEWLKKRLKGIGGSDAAAAVGMSPYKSNVELWEEKTGRRKAADISDNLRVKYGKEAEKHLRELFKLDFPQYFVDYDEFGMIANNPDTPFCFATLDGELSKLDDSKPMRLIRRKGILEIKTCEIMRSIQWKEWDGQVPQHYYIQILHQLLATGYDFAIVKAQLKYHDKNGDMQAAIRHYKIERADVLADLERLSEREKVFWRCVETDTKPAQILPEI
ncbi:YqaJ-like viral recombinase domain protein [anaerobic digester metagenome]